MSRSLLPILLLSTCCAACVRPSIAPSAPTRAARLSVTAASSDGTAGEPPLGSLSMALHLYAAPPPSSLLAKVGAGPGWPASLRFPSPRHVVGRTFGSGRSRCHLAIDLGARRGDPVFAAEAGTIAYVGPFGTGGLVVMVVHAGGFVTVYAHLSSALVQPGDAVERGQPIARSGSTGNSAGPHLHFVLLVNGHPVDPLPLLEPRPSFVGDVRRFATPERAADAWRNCPPRGRRFEALGNQAPRTD